MVEGDRTLNVVFLANEGNEASVPDIGFLNRRSQDFKIGYLSWLAGLTEQITLPLILVYVVSGEFKRHKA